MRKLLLLLLFLAQPALIADEALTECRLIEEVAERVGCYDKIVDSHFPMESSDSGELPNPLELPEANAVPDSKSLFGTTDAEAKRIVEASLSIEQISQIEAIVATVQRSATSKLTVTLENGQIWRQLDGQRLRLNSGETVIVRKASLGSYLMEKQSGSRSIRVKRAN